MFANKEKNMDAGSEEGLCRIIVITNINLAAYFKGFLKEFFNKSYENIRVDIYSESDINTVIEFEDKKNVLAVLFWINFEEKYPDFLIYNMENYETAKEHIDILADDIKQTCCLVRQNYSCQIFWMDFEFYCGRNRHALWELNYQISALQYEVSVFMEQEGIDSIGLSDLTARMGVENAINEKGKYRFNLPYKKELFYEAAKEIYRRFEILSGKYIKCIVLDCDEVLWKGAIDTEGVEGIGLSDFGPGKKYKDFQRYLKLLYDNGVLLALCTKNDESDIAYIVDNNKDMVLKRENFVAIYADWTDKYKNILSLASLLNIDYRNMLFIDDSEYEIDFVKKNIKDINVLLFQIDTIYDDISRYNFPHRLQYSSVVTRNQTYKNNLEREVAKSNCNTIEEFIESLHIVIEIKKASPLEYKRISELSLRTNKCSNLTRYTYEELVKKAECGNYDIYSVYVSDRFGDLGLVGAFAVYQDCLELFCVSCRALGRNIEDKLAAYISNNYKIKKIKFVSNGKNSGLYKLLQEKLSIPIY